MTTPLLALLSVAFGAGLRSNNYPWYGVTIVGIAMAILVEAMLLNWRAELGLPFSSYTVVINFVKYTLFALLGFGIAMWLQREAAIPPRRWF